MLQKDQTIDLLLDWEMGSKLLTFLQLQLCRTWGVLEKESNFLRCSGRGGF